jgi:hypothetical protein
MWICFTALAAEELIFSLEGPGALAPEESFKIFLYHLTRSMSMNEESRSNRNTAYLRIAIILCFILFAAIVRILPHPWNFTPVGAMALFVGAKLGRSWMAFPLPLVALFAGDVFVGFHKLMFAVYLSFALSVLVGILFRKRQSVGPLFLATLLGATQFFLITNFAVWTFLTGYAKTLSGLITCYVTGIPLFGNTLAGDAFYTAVLFGGYALAERFVPALREMQSPVLA